VWWRAREEVGLGGGGHVARKIKLKNFMAKLSGLLADLQLASLQSPYLKIMSEFPKSFQGCMIPSFQVLHGLKVHPITKSQVQFEFRV
jgi:hypothetical protein